jgi:hypothetical protein
MKMQNIFGKYGTIFIEKVKCFLLLIQELLNVQHTLLSVQNNVASEIFVIVGGDMTIGNE